VGGTHGGGGGFLKIISQPLPSPSQFGSDLEQPHATVFFFCVCVKKLPSKEVFILPNHFIGG
jgi:hypothetical protein